MRSAIEDELLAWMAEDPWQEDPARFERIGLSLFRFQFGACRPYALLCESLERTPETVRSVAEIPAVPTGAFKEFDLRCFERTATLRTFRTSGTSTQKRGALHLDRLDLYEASLLSSLRNTLLIGWPAGHAVMRILAEDPAKNPESSLSYMFGALLEHQAAENSGFDLHAGTLEIERLRQAVEQARKTSQPMLIAGTAFAFVHLLDATEGEDWSLPPDSRIMETGGFKGRSREVSRDVLHASLSERFAVPASRIINQYGMTELGSQFYDSTIVDPTGPRRKLCPPWTRVRFIDPDSGRDVPTGEIGLVLIHDLANTGSVAALQTADLGRALSDRDGRMLGFDVIGRAQGAEAKGCSIATDIMLEATRRNHP